MAVTRWTLSRLSTEWVGGITMLSDGIVVPSWTYALVRAYEEPANEAAINNIPTPDGGKLGILVGPGTSHVLVRGIWIIWARYVDALEAPVLNDFGQITIT
jgi:hypothetical protein